MQPFYTNETDVSRILMESICCTNKVKMSSQEEQGWNVIAVATNNSITRTELFWRRSLAGAFNIDYIAQIPKMPFMPSTRLLCF